MKIVKFLIKLVIWLAVLGAAGYSGWRYFDSKKEEAAVITYRTAPLVKTDIYRTVEATGTVQPIKEVEVGAQVNGRIVKLFVDYNSVVTNGQVVALIDPQVYEANYKNALGELHTNEANIKKCEAQLVLAEKTLKRKQELVKNNMAPVADYDIALESRDTAIASLEAAKASVERSQASVSQARANLNYCTIISPVNGVVIVRSVDEGQTVVSSMNAVPIFKIATDLKRIQVEATVPEADIGNVKEGQAVTFTVDSYPGLKFKGDVCQVRMASTTTSSVVTYPVIIEADNLGGRLFPGMTANISVHIDEAKGVLAVTSAAFRYRPMTPPAAPMGGAPGASAPAAAPAKEEKDDTQRPLYLMDANGQPEKVMVEIGLSDGNFTEIKSPKGLEKRVAVLGIQPPMKKGGMGPHGGAGSSNPFMPKPPMRRKPNAGPGGPH
ncbi:MAG: efflux RND transporter periplasmic adaptor subunit [Kiritimatiellae bacterium]|nr:efflux RND transporter periplasmic adaptor subunit [Kiritimatiellia bacterium]